MSSGTRFGSWLASALLPLLLVAAPAQAATIFSDNFDNSFPGEPALIGSIWPKWPTATDHLNTSTCCITENHNHTPGGVASERQDQEDPYTLANYHDFGPLAVAVTATAWVWDDNWTNSTSVDPINCFVGLYGDSTNPAVSPTDYFLIGLAPTFAVPNNYGFKSLKGGSVSTAVTRTNANLGSADGSGWVKLAIQADSLTSGGQVRFYINDALVGTSSRAPGVSLRYFFMGSQYKDHQDFWYDDITIEAAIPEITSITATNQTVSLNFTSSDTNELASAFTLLSASAVTGPYTPTADATITGSAGLYQTTAPATNSVQFYRIRR